MSCRKHQVIACFFALSLYWEIFLSLKAQVGSIYIGGKLMHKPVMTPFYETGEKLGKEKQLGKTG